MSENSEGEETEDAGTESDSRKLRPPNRKRFEEEMDSLHQQIQEKESELERVKSSQGISVSSELKNLRDEKSASIARREHIDMDLEKLKKVIPEKMKQLGLMESSLYYKNEDRINAAIQKLEWNLNVQTFKLSEEKKIVTEIDSLKRSKKTLIQYRGLKQEIAGIRDKQRRMREERDTYFRAVSEIKKKEDRLRQNISTAKSKFAIVKEEIDTLYERKRQLVASFRRQRDEYQGVRDKLRREGWKRKEDEKKAYNADRKKEWAEMEAERIPFKEEILLCNTLIRYLGRFSANPLEPTHDSFSPASSLDEPDQAEEIESGQYVLLRKSDDADGLDYSGGARKLSRKNRRSRKQSLVKRVKHTPEVLAQFLTLHLSAPNTNAEVAESIEALLARKAYFEREQQQGEDCSEAGISGTESTVCELSRQASKTESCEDTNPGDHVYNALLKGCQGGGEEEGEAECHTESCGAEGGRGGSVASENSDTLSPSSDVAGEAEGGESHTSTSGYGDACQDTSVGYESQKSAASSMGVSFAGICSRAGAVSHKTPSAREGESKHSLKNGRGHWENAEYHQRTIQRESGVVPNPTLVAQEKKLSYQQQVPSFKDQPLVHSKDPTLSPKSSKEAIKPSSLPLGQSAAAAHVSTAVQDLCISSPLDFPSLQPSLSPRSGPAVSSPDRLIVPGQAASPSCKIAAPFPKESSAKPAYSATVSTSSNRSGQHQHQHQPQHQHQHQPQHQHQHQQGHRSDRHHHHHHHLQHQALTMTKSLPVQPSPPLLVMDTEEFPPLSISAGLVRRGSSLSTKSSGSSSAVAESVQPWVKATSSTTSTTTSSHVSPTPLVSHAVSHVPGQTAVTPHIPTHPGSAGPSTPTDLVGFPARTAPPLPGSHISSVDKSSTERWVESSIVFANDFPPLQSEEKDLLITSESTRL